ncbi:MAG TPA: hypothetical protein PKY88_07735 [Anaerohalosphaeraceae bacterium]|nr:hypothetical protein [Anaerohalosphaeraceae bacterium]
MMRLTGTTKSPHFVLRSPRAEELMRSFGLDHLDLKEQSQSVQIVMEAAAGQICLLTGPSGTGKTLLLRQFFQQTAAESRLWLEDIVLESDRSVIDCVGGPLEEAVRLLSHVGLGDVFALLRSPAHLSSGQQFRYRLLRAVLAGRPWLFADEFGSALDLPGAAMLALQTAHLIRQRRQTLFAASARDELAPYFAPDIWLRLDAAAHVEVLYFRSKKNLFEKGMPPDDLKVSQAAIRRRGLKS